MRKQFAEFLPLLSAGCQSGVTLEQEAELFLNPRSSISLNVRGKTPGVALPSGTLPENGVWPRAPAGLLDWLELLDELL